MDQQVMQFKLSKKQQQLAIPLNELVMGSYQSEPLL